MLTAPAPQQALPFATPHNGGRTRAYVKANRAEVLRYLGYTGQQLEDHLAARTEALIHEAETTLPALYTWRIFAIDQERSCWLDAVSDEAPKAAAVPSAEIAPSAPTTLTAAGKPAASDTKQPCVILQDTQLELHGTSITRHLTGAIAVAALSCTLGLTSERELRTKNALNATDALIYGAAASSLVEAGADAACANIASFASEYKLYTGERYSPGYGDLALSTQQAFAQALNLHKTLGISLTESNLLIPLKSMTALVGIFPQAPTVSFDSPCEGCVNEHACPFRKKGLTCYDS